MFKYIVFAAVLAIAFAAPQPGVLTAAPVAYSAGYVSPVAYGAPVGYTAGVAPVAYSAGVAPVAYSAGVAPVAYSAYPAAAPVLKYY